MGAKSLVATAKLEVQQEPFQYGSAQHQMSPGLLPGSPHDTMGVNPGLVPIVGEPSECASATEKDYVS